MSVKFECAHSYTGYGLNSVVSSNFGEVFSSLMSDFKKVGYTVVGFSRVPDCMVDYLSMNYNDRNDEELKDIWALSKFHEPSCYTSVFVHPYIPSQYSHTHSQILSAHGLTWGGGDNQSFSIHPDFARIIGAQTYTLKGGRWKRKPRRYSMKFIRALRTELGFSVHLCSSDRCIRVRARISGYYKALTSSFDDLPLYIHGGCGELNMRLARYRLGLPVPKEAYSY